MDEKIDCREQEAHETALPPAATWIIIVIEMD
jgi:hypothetical protein